MNETYELTSDEPTDEPDEGTDEPRDEHTTFRWITSTLMKPLTHTITYESLQLHTLCFALLFAYLWIVSLRSNVYKEKPGTSHTYLSPTSFMRSQTLRWSIDSWTKSGISCCSLRILLFTWHACRGMCFLNPATKKQKSEGKIGNGWWWFGTSTAQWHFLFTFQKKPNSLNFLFRCTLTRNKP